MVSKLPVDYGRNKRASDQLAEKIQQFWADKGYDWVRVWTETHTYLDGVNEYYIRSNISMTVPQLQRE